MHAPTPTEALVTADWLEFATMEEKSCRRCKAVCTPPPAGLTLPHGLAKVRITNKCSYCEQIYDGNAEGMEEMQVTPNSKDIRHG